MPRFVTDKDVAFFQNVNKELIDTVIETVVTLWKIAIENSKVNIYGEATKKEYYTGVKLTCLIDRKNTQPTAEGQTVDTVQPVTFNFLRLTLQEKNTYPELGDIVEFHGGYYEIENINENQLLAGQPWFNFSLACEAHLTRRSNLHLDEAQQ